MYVPAHFAVPEADARALLERIDVVDLVTAGAEGLLATFLPVIFDADAGEHGALLGHVARNNPQWRTADGTDALAIGHEGDHYVSPSAYATKAEHGRVVPTWNHVTVHVHGSLVVHDDAAWCRDLVERLTERHEERREHPWVVDDAPASYVEGQLRAIVGLELRISRIEAKAKLSQNRSAADVEGVVADLESRGEHAQAARVREAGRSAGRVR